MHVGNLYYTEPVDPAGRAAVGAVAGRQGVPLQLGHRGDRVRAQARAPPPAAGRLRGHGARLPRPHHGRAVGHAAGGQAGAVRAAGARLQGRAPRRRRGAGRRRRRRTPPPCCSSPSRARAASTRCPTRRWPPPARPATSTAPCSSSTRSSAAWAAPATGGPGSAPGVRPDVMTVAKGLGGGLPIGACLTTPELRRHAPARRPRLDLRRRSGDRGRRQRGARRDRPRTGSSTACAPRASGCAAALARRSGLDVRGRGPDAGVRGRRTRPALARRLLLEHRLVVNATGPGHDPPAAAAHGHRRGDRRGRRPVISASS